jgi:hypothetical protein
MEKELLSIYETFKEFRSMLLGPKIDIYTDHKNLTYSSTVNQRVIQQLNYLEEYSPTYHHIPGKMNNIADIFSCLPGWEYIKYTLEEEKERLSNIELNNSYHTSILDDPELVDCFLNLPDLNYQPFPLDFVHIAQGQ